jgi:hypothetical protein
MDQKQLTQKSKAEHPQTKTKNKKNQQKQKTKKKQQKENPTTPHGIHLTKKHLSPKIKKRNIMFLLLLYY